MEIIKKISQKIDSELEDAQHYIKCAYKVKDEYPKLADTYYKLSLAEMEHVTMLHDNVVAIINEYKMHNEVPEAMEILYEYLHERQKKWAAKIKANRNSISKFKGGA